jgi:sigma-B regulation protein RsbU (phosphoserine phosphatase)
VSFSIFIAVIYVILGAVLFLLGTVILRENPRNRVNRITGLMLFFAGLGPVFGAVGTALGPEPASRYLSSAPLYYNLFYFWELFFPLLVFFASVFPVLHGWFIRWRRLKYLIFVPHIFHIIWVSFLARPELDFLDPDKLTGIAKVILSPLGYILRLASLFFSVLLEFHIKFFSIVNLAYIVIAFWLLLSGYRQLKNPRLRGQVRVLLWGIPSAVSTYAVAFILPSLGVWQLPEAVRYGLTVAALVFGAGSIAWSIIRHQFLDVRLIIRQSLVFSITSALLVAVYLLVIIQVSGLIKDTLELDTPLVDIAFIVLILIFFQPVKEQIDDVVTRFFLRDKADYRTIIEQYSADIAAVFDPGVLKRRMMEVITGPVYVERAFFAFRTNADDFSLEWDGHADRGTGVRADDSFFRALAQHDKPVFFDEFAEEEIPSEILARLKEWGCRMVVPIREQDNLAGVLFLSQKVSGFRYSYEDVNLLSVLTNQLAAGLTNSRLYAEALEKQKMEEELNVARQIQMQLLPQSDPAGPGYAFSSFAQPSRQVGGDYFDYFKRPNGKLGMVIADVSGKGVPAALLVSQLQAILRAEARTDKSLPGIISAVNQIITESTSPEKFATLFYADLDPATRELVYVNAGHNYPIVVRPDGTTANLITGGLVLGVIASASFEYGRIQLASGDLVVLYTDGLSELRDPKGDEYGEERLLRLLTDNRHLSAEALKNKLIRDATRFALGELDFDDLTLMILKIEQDDRQVNRVDPR